MRKVSYQSDSLTVRRENGGIKVKETESFQKNSVSRAAFRTAILSIAFLFILLAGGYLLYGQAKTETPKTVYEECQKLQTAIEDVDDQIKDVEYQMERARKAVANYHYVQSQNAAIIEELKQWAESE